jgi:hypothetical protein
LIELPLVLGLTPTVWLYVTLFRVLLWGGLKFESTLDFIFWYLALFKLTLLALSLFKNGEASLATF